MVSIEHYYLSIPTKMIPSSNYMQGLGKAWMNRAKKEWGVDNRAGKVRAGRNKLFFRKNHKIDFSSLLS